MKFNDGFRQKLSRYIILSNKMNKIIYMKKRTMNYFIADIFYDILNKNKYFDDGNRIYNPFNRQ